MSLASSPSPSAMLRHGENRMSTSALYLVRMDVAHDHEATFNEVYDREHVRNLRACPASAGQPLPAAVADRAALPRRLRAGQSGRPPDAGVEDGRRAGPVADGGSGRIR